MTVEAMEAHERLHKTIDQQAALIRQLGEAFLSAWGKMEKLDHTFLDEREFGDFYNAKTAYKAWKDKQ